MNPQIENLYKISAKNERYIIGLMSGTSLDGLDIALCKISNSGTKTSLILKHFVTKPFNGTFRNEIREIFSKKTVDQQLISGLNVKIALVHAQLVNEALYEWGIKSRSIDLIASHGQTVYHAPQSLTHNINMPNSTLQLGDGDHIAVNTGIITISDFRQKHIAKGGEGAPLAAYGDYILFTNSAENRILLNIGGISNYTFLPSSTSSLKAYATDIGPGNTLMNQYMHKHYQQDMDEDAKIAKKGIPNQLLLDELLNDAFLKQAIPKTTGPERFDLNYLLSAQTRSNTEALLPEDVMSTLNKFTAISIAESIQHQIKDLANTHIYISGGGLHNPLLIENIKNSLPNVRVSDFHKLGLNPDAKEACLFALLANETVAGKADNITGIKDSPTVCMGKVSFPT